MDGRAGVMLAGSPVDVHPGQSCLPSHCVFLGTGVAGKKIRITVDIKKHHAVLLAEPEQNGDEVRFVTAGAMPAFGLIDPSSKIVRTSGAQIVQGVVHAGATVPMHYFFGTPHEIYAEYLKARDQA